MHKYVCPVSLSLSLSIYMYIHIGVCTNVYIYIYIYIYRCAYMFGNMYIHLHMSPDDPLTSLFSADECVFIAQQQDRRVPHVAGHEAGSSKV